MVFDTIWAVPVSTLELGSLLVRQLIRYLAVILCLVFAGCSTRQGQRSWSLYEDLIYPMMFPEKDDFDRMWEEGYGFNNPNASKRPSNPRDN